MFFGKPNRGTPRKKSAKNATPLDRKQAALRDTEEKLRKQKEHLEQLIHEAPRLREEQTRRRREQFATEPRLSRTALVDKHVYHAATVANPAFGQRRLRSEKRDGLYLFLFLIAVLVSVVFWICRLVL
ncbi:MAG: hypothetical protein NTZ46_04615 [Verrucomicrobia bacterium]|nr:hypothetical protein [Verrucomicrobiota bacterium]